MLFDHKAYQQAQTEFTRYFKNYLKKTQNWDIQIQWGEIPEGEKPMPFAVYLHSPIILALNQKDFKSLEQALQDKASYTPLLKQKAQELVQEIQQSLPCPIENKL